MIKTILAATLAACAFAAPAFAQQACGDREQVIETMHAKWGEVEIATGISSGMAMSIFANTTTGTYTVMLTPPGHPDIACVVAIGTDWTLLPAALGEAS